ncbi:MAG TPA: phytanoyl-CoA dioxygenase family protein [Verrucomicrobiae bacterium]|nr:phytanoyl-CoA dioxygenase family protein [Verrucomicrobiae bacterium]
MITTELEDAARHIGNPQRLRELDARDGFLFFRGLLDEALILELRQTVLDYASRTGWLAPGESIRNARAMAGKRVGDFQDPDWVNLQVHVQNRSEMWALGDCAAIHRALRAVEARSSYLCLSTANTCRVFSPHPDMATQPHQDANYVRVIGDFWTAWIPLGDCPRELGPLALLAGSHRGGLRHHDGEGIVQGGVAVPEDAVWSTIDFHCGDAVLFRPHTLHRSLPNCSGDRLRLSVDFRYGFWDDAAEVDWRATSLDR